MPGERTYKALYVQTRGTLRADLRKYLNVPLHRRSPLPFEISDRAAGADEHSVPGHWESDVIVGLHQKSAIGTLVERSTRFTLLLQLRDSHSVDEVAITMLPTMRHLAEHLLRSSSGQREIDTAGIGDFTFAQNARLVLCDPHLAWLGGSNENTARLLRHWFAKDADLSVHTAADLQRIQDALNSRPRPTLEMRSPAQAMSDLLQRRA